MRKVDLRLVLFFLFLGIEARAIPLESSPYDAIIFKDRKGNTYAQVVSTILADQLKVSVGSIVASTNRGLGDAEVINKTLELLKDIKGGRILIKRGIYDLGKKGIRIPSCDPILIQGEGFDANLPKSWEKVEAFALGGTYLVYEGEEAALKWEPISCAGSSMELRKFAVVLLESSKFGIDIPTHTKFWLDRISVITVKKSGVGIRADSRAGNVCYLTNLIVKGPFETALDTPIDWAVVVNLHLDGFTAYGMVYTWMDHVIGGLIRGGGK